MGRQPLDSGRPQQAKTADGLLASAQLASLQPSPAVEVGWDEPEDEETDDGEVRRPADGAASVGREEAGRMASLVEGFDDGPQSALGGEREGSPWWSWSQQ